MKQTFFKVTLLVTLFSFAIANSNAQEKQTEAKPATTSPQKRVISPAPARKASPPLTARGNQTLSQPFQNLMKFMGRWTADAKLTSDGKTGVVKYTMTGRLAADGKAIYIDESFRDSIFGSMKAANMIGYNEDDSKVYWYSVDGKGVPHEHTGSWKGNDTLSITHNGTRKGKDYAEKISFIFKGRDEISLTFVATLGGTETEKASGVFYREKPASRDEMKPAPVKK